jgi:uncharacterized protein (TIGR01244 family)
MRQPSSLAASLGSAWLAVLPLGLATLPLGLAAAPLRPQVTKESVPGVTNFARVETTVACGGTIKPEGIAELKQRGFKSIFDLQLPDERSADVPGEAAAAKAAGLTFVHVPFTPSAPDTSSVDRFLQAISDPANEPAFIHCGGGNRAAGFWFIKRVIVDKWDTDRAMTEAVALGLSGAPMKQFALDYVQSHAKR